MESPMVMLDIRPVPVRDKHPRIFRTFDEMNPGETLLLVNDHDPKPLYYQFAAERAEQFDWNYVEQGPEVWKVTIKKKGRTACRHIYEAHEHHHLEKATEALKEDHRVIEKILVVIEKLMERPQPPLEAWQKALDFVRGFADRCHHLKEEKIFFPALEQHGIPREGGPVGMMLVEHEEGRAYVGRMAEALELAQGNPETATPALFENARAYLRLLRQHIQKEDEVLFEMADGALTTEEQQKLLQEFEEHEAKEIGSGVHEKYLKIVEELEAYNILRRSPRNRTGR